MEKKLTLSKETLRVLKDEELKKVAGGQRTQTMLTECDCASEASRCCSTSL
jgi:natural product precursor